MDRVAAHHYRTPLDPPLRLPDEALRACREGETTMVTEEFKAKQFPSDDVDIRLVPRVSQFDEAVKRRRSATIAKMQIDRLVPRSSKSRDMVPPHIREKYTELWQQQDREWLKGIAWEASLRGRLRMWVKKAVGI